VVDEDDEDEQPVRVATRRLSSGMVPAVPGTLPAKEPEAASVPVRPLPSERSLRRVLALAKICDAMASKDGYAPDRDLGLNAMSAAARKTPPPTATTLRGVLRLMGTTRGSRSSQKRKVFNSIKQPFGLG